MDTFIERFLVEAQGVADPDDDAQGRVSLWLTINWSVTGTVASVGDGVVTLNRRGADFPVHVRIAHVVTAEYV